MKKSLYYLLLCFFSMNIIEGQTPSQTNSIKSFGSGEYLLYTMDYGLLTGGKALLSVKDTVLFGENTLHLTGTAYTVGLADVLYKIRDTYESFISPNSLYPVKSIRNIREGRYRYYNEVIFKHGADSTHLASQKSGEKYVPADIYDIVSAFYVGREKYFNDSMKKGDVITIHTYFADKEFPLRIRYMGNEVIKTSFGKLECYKFSPVTETGRAFKTENDMQVWITRDKNKLPVRVRFNLVVGAFVCDLQEFKGLKNPFSSFIP
ncbi:MAG TPA: DUF3108 domain-containing protein [Marinilabiliaceae bacterium]|nr:DUF3108 domain-containing protein [Marinilabiliaceae bacterium]